MLNRMVIGLPRSGTTWAANWLTYGGELTAHDPLYFHHYSDWASTACFTGVSCTAIWRWPEFVLKQTCPILVLHRPMVEVRESLAAFDTVDKGEWLDPKNDEKLLALQGPNITHMPYDWLFNTFEAGDVWQRMKMPGKYDHRRHQELKRMRVMPRDPHPPEAPKLLYDRVMAELREKDERAKNVC